MAEYANRLQLGAVGEKNLALRIPATLGSIPYPCQKKKAIWTVVAPACVRVRAARERPQVKSDTARVKSLIYSGHNRCLLRLTNFPLSNHADTITFYPRSVWLMKNARITMFRELIQRTYQRKKRAPRGSFRGNLSARCDRAAWHCSTSKRPGLLLWQSARGARLCPFMSSLLNIE